MFALTALVLLGTPEFPGETQAYRFAAFLGFTEDGAYAAYTLWEKNCEPGELWERQDAVIVEVATGTETRYTLALEGSTAGARKTNGPAKEFEAWKKAHPVSSRAGAANGEHRAVVEVKPGSVRWRKSTAHFEPDERAGTCDERGKCTQGPSVFYSVGDASNAWPVFTAPMHQSAGSYQPGRVEVFWSPDGRRAAFVTNWGWVMPENPGHGEVLFVPAAGPRLELLTDSKFSDAAARAAMRALDSAGVVVLRRGKAKSARESSVVYASKGAEDFAAKVAAAVPGGASVEPLTWKAEAEVVLALGASAAK
jgi:hypothetical protein